MVGAGLQAGGWEPRAARRLAHEAALGPAALWDAGWWGMWLKSASLLQTNTNYSQEKHRCEYLHSKLAHIKRLIAEYDQRQLQAWP